MHYLERGVVCAHGRSAARLEIARAIVCLGRRIRVVLTPQLEQIRRSIVPRASAARERCEERQPVHNLDKGIHGCGDGPSSRGWARIWAQIIGGGAAAQGQIAEGFGEGAGQAVEPVVDGAEEQHATEMIVPQLCGQLTGGEALVAAMDKARAELAYVPSQQKFALLSSASELPAPPPPDDATLRMR